MARSLASWAALMPRRLPTSNKIGNVADGVHPLFGIVMVQIALNDPRRHFPMLRNQTAQFAIVHAEYLHFRLHLGKVIHRPGEGDGAENLRSKKAAHHRLPDIVQKSRGKGFWRRLDAGVFRDGFGGHRRGYGMLPKCVSAPSIPTGSQNRCVRQEDLAHVRRRPPVTQGT